MFTRLHGRAVPLAALAVASLLTACSQGNGGSLPASSASQASATTLKGHVAPQAKAMLSLVRGKNRAVVDAPAGISKLFAPMHPDAQSALYNSIVVTKSGQLSSDIASEGFECCSVDEFGDGMNLTANNARVTQVSVVLDSWGCESGFWNSGDCSTTRGATFSEPITLKIYSVTTDGNGNPAPGDVLVQATHTFNVPYRPSADPRCEGPNAGKFIGKADKECDNGFANKITFNVKLPKTTIPQQVIATVAYNTSDSGYSPYGEGTQCFTGPGGCGYDALNVSAWGEGASSGTQIDPNGVFVYYTNPGFYCNGTGNGTQGLQLDTPCWTGYHPEIKIVGKGGSAS